MGVSIAMEDVALAKRHNTPDFAQLVAALSDASTDKCVYCGRTLGGLLGSFRWGLINGHGECAECGFPYVYYHRHEVEPGQEILLQAWVPNADIPLAEKS